MKVSFLIFFALLLSVKGFSCTCIGEISLKDELKVTDLVFVGKVISVKEIQVDDNPKYSSGSHVEFSYRFLVERVYKGQSKSDTIEIISPNEDGMCGVSFDLGKKYIVFSKKEKIAINHVNYSRFKTNTCSRTQYFSVEFENELLEFVSKSRKKQK